MWPIEGSPRYGGAQESFANYLTVLRLIDPLATIPEPPSEPVTWQTRPKFFPFAAWESGYYTLKAETDFEENTTILFSSVPPSKTVFNGEWYGEKIVGHELFEFGLFADEEFDGIHDMIEAQFGSIDSTQKIWGRCWEVQTDTGNIRVLKDPCTIDPTNGAPGATLDITLYNDYYEECEYSRWQAQDDEVNVIGDIEFEFIEADGQASLTMNLDEGKTTEDIIEFEVDTYWADGEFFLGLESYDGSNPFEFSIYPDI